MKKLSGGHVIRLIVGLALTGLLCASYAGKDPRRDILVKGSDDRKEVPLVLQTLDYKENPVDIPNPDRGFYRGRWQAAETPFGRTPEVDHRVPVDANSLLYHGRQMPPVEGDDIKETEPFNKVNVDPYVGGTGV